MSTEFIESLSLPTSPASSPLWEKRDAIMVRKQTESPTLSCSDSSEDDLKQPCHRLGRVIDDDKDEFPQEYTVEVREGFFSFMEQELMKEIDMLNKLAAMDSSEYQSRLVSNSLPTPQHPQLLRLAQSIHRFHSMVNNLTVENDQQTTEIVQVQSKLDNCQHRVQMLEKAVSKLHSRNLKLKKQSKADKSVARKLLEQVKNFSDSAAKRREEEEFYKLVAKVQQHEQVMRERVDSNFSDLDGLQDLDAKSVSSASTQQSLVTDDGVATLRISRDPKLTWPIPRGNEDESESSLGDDKQPSKDRKLPVKDSSKPPAIPTNDGKPENTTTSSPKLGLGDNNPFAMFLNPRPTQPYTLSFMAPFTLQYVAIQMTVEQPPNPDGDETPSIIETVFAVCGYHGFDSNKNVKPTIGARLLLINKVAVSSSWTVEELEAKIKAKGNKVELTFRNENWGREQKDRITLAVQEQERLHPTQREGNFLRMRSQSNGDANKPNILGFLTFNHHGNHKSPNQQERASTIDLKEYDSSGSQAENQAEKASSTHDGTNPLMFWKKNSSPERIQEEAVSFEDPDHKLKFPLPTEESEALSTAQTAPIIAKDEAVCGNQVVNSNGNSGQEPVRKVNRSGSFKSSVKNVGMLFALTIIPSPSKNAEKGSSFDEEDENIMFVSPPSDEAALLAFSSSETCDKGENVRGGENVVKANIESSKEDSSLSKGKTSMQVHSSDPFTSSMITMGKMFAFR